MSSAIALNHVTVMLEEVPGATQWQVSIVGPGLASEFYLPVAGSAASRYSYLAT